MLGNNVYIEEVLDQYLPDCTYASSSCAPMAHNHNLKLSEGLPVYHHSKVYSFNNCADVPSANV